MTVRLGIMFAILCALVTGAAAQTADPTGIWLTQAGDAKVRVSKCDGGICGVIVWLRSAR